MIAKLAPQWVERRPYWQVHERVWLCWRHYIQHLIWERSGSYIKGPTDFLVGGRAIWCAECHEELGRQAERDFPWENGMQEKEVEVPI